MSVCVYVHAVTCVCEREKGREKEVTRDGVCYNLCRPDFVCVCVCVYVCIYCLIVLNPLHGSLFNHQGCVVSELIHATSSVLISLYPWQQSCREELMAYRLTGSVSYNQLVRSKSVSHMIFY